jgi:hypothetical protein
LVSGHTRRVRSAVATLTHHERSGRAGMSGEVGETCPEVLIRGSSRHREGRLGRALNEAIEGGAAGSGSPIQLPPTAALKVLRRISVCGRLD